MWYCLSMFIVFEGVEGAGKSSQLALLQQALATQGREVIALKEPGGTPMGEAVRSILLNPAYTIAPLTEIFLFNASRHQLVQATIEPALASGKLVICDRYIGSSIAYQAYGRGLPLEQVQRMCHEATHGLMPDLTLLLDMDPELGLQRVAARGQVDRLEQADLAFHQRVGQGFLEQAAQDSTWQRIPAEQSPEAIHDTIMKVVEERLPFGS